MDIKKYLTNKDIELSNDDINIEKLEKDIRKGYVLSEEVDKAKQETQNELSSKYTELESKYNSLDKTYNDLQAKNVELNNANSNLKLEVEMVSQGFKKEQFGEISKLRSTLFADEEDNAKAISGIKEKFKDTYFPKVNEEPKKAEIPNETFDNSSTPLKQEFKVTRKTPIKDLIKK